MALVWSKLRPQDRYQVHVTSELSLFQIKVLGQLYQPLMGSLAYSLYLTLISEVEGDRHISTEKNHQWLMNLMNTHLDQIYQSKLRLEALGLVKTFVTRKEEEQFFFEYELFPPLGAEQFFQDDILSICLYNQVGAHRYKDLRTRYTAFKEPLEKQQKEEITQEFHQVFSSIHPSELVVKEGSEKEKELQAIHDEFPLSLITGQSTGNQPQFEQYPLDVEALKSFFMKGIAVDSILTPKNIREIKKVAFFYQLDTWSLSRIIQDSLTLEDELDISIFREKAKEWYRLQQGGKPPHITQMTQPIAQRVFKEEEVQTEEEKHLSKLEQISPLYLLEAYQGGGKVADADIKLVEELLFDYQLSPGVVNVLLEYILLTNEFKLPKNLVTKVAAHWKRLQIRDVKQAQVLARKEHQQYKQWKNKKQNDTSTSSTQKRSYSKSSAGRKDILPDWIVDQSQQEAFEKQDASTSLTEEQKRERMEQLLKSLGEWKEKGGE